jgi:mannose-1-phosphate guanylyltransferase/mannose-6-phosphate isomerase
MTMLEICPVILAGGSGTRLWPLSRENYPKQMLRLIGDRSLLQETVLRCEGLNLTRQRADAVVVNDPIIVCNEEHRSLTVGQLAGIGVSGARILLEPVGRNTAPALTIAALAVREQDSDPLLLVMPADHVVKNRDRFNASVLTGLGYAKERMIVAFGVVGLVKMRGEQAPETGEA